MPCGMWVATAAADHIFFEKKTSQYHQGHIILHEVGHMLCRHTMTDAAGYLLGTRADQEGSDLVLDADQVMGALLRTSYSDRQEREAELVASMILERAMAWDSKNATAGERYFGEVLGFE